MTPFFKEIFTYHHHYNYLMIKELENHLKELSSPTFPLFCHVLNAHHIWNSRILGYEQAYAVNQLQALEECASINDSNLEDTFQILDTVDLGEEVNYRTSNGTPYRNSVRDILFHVANHSTHHKGQIVADFRRNGIAPIITDYIFYKR